MLFAKRRWALRVTERIEHDARSEEATALVDMIIVGAKQFAEMMSHKKVRVSDPELILTSAASMVTNLAAINRIVDDLGTSPELGFPSLSG